MAQNESPLSPFKSRYGGGYIPRHKFLAEAMCARKARMKGIDLPSHFWNGKFLNGDYWKREYCLQLRQALSLLKIYSCEAIIKALRTKEGSKIYSFGAKWLDPLIKTEQEKIDILKKKMEEEAKAEEVKEEPVVSQPREAFIPQNNNKLSRLKD